MNSLTWWHQLDEQTRDWLVAHNGEAIDDDILARIVAASGAVPLDAWWVGETGPEGFRLSDEATDWIESVANLE